MKCSSSFTNMQSVILCLFVYLIGTQNNVLWLLSSSSVVPTEESTKEGSQKSQEKFKKHIPLDLLSYTSFARVTFA